jgi:hypothetical protein
MNCKELRAHWEMEPIAAINRRPDSVELAEHIAACSECHRFVEEWKDVAKHLDLLRLATPEIPSSLDAAMLARYRDYQAERSRSAVFVPLMGRISLRGVLTWAAAISFAVIVAYGGLLLFIPNQRGSVDPHLRAQQSMVAPKSVTAVKGEMAGSQKSARNRAKSVHALAKRTKHLAPVAEQDPLFPTRFQSLMYCDQFSCPGAMDVIHLRLPGPVLGVTPASARANGLVSAYVLVGPDGIARGIRVVE